MFLDEPASHKIPSNLALEEEEEEEEWMASRVIIADPPLISDTSNACNHVRTGRRTRIRDDVNNNTRVIESSTLISVMAAEPGVTPRTRTNERAGFARSLCALACLHSQLQPAKVFCCCLCIFANILNIIAIDRVGGERERKRESGTKRRGMQFRTSLA